MSIALIIIAIFIGVLLFNTAKFKPSIIDKNCGIVPYTDDKIDIEKAARNLSEAVKIKTISNIDYTKFDFDKFEEFISFIERTYPLVHQNLSKERVNKYSLVFKWKGKDTNKKPILLMGHYDVVPVERGTEKDWTYDAFSGEIAEGQIWGRGTLDDKISVISILEAAETLLKQGYIPERNIYFSFGHDEEVGGNQGASKVAEKFKKEGLEFDFVLDEGGAVIEKPMNIDKTVATIGICEKGSTNVKITVKGDGGHSSTPPKNTALGKLSVVITRLEKNQMRPEITKPLEDFLNIIGREMGYGARFAISNIKILKPLLYKIFEKNSMTNAMIRTTTAATMAKASDAPNVLPQKASAVINCRIRPGDTVEDLIYHIKKIAGDIEVEIEVLLKEVASAVTDVNSKQYINLCKVIKKIYPNVIISPYLMLGGTDSRKYEKVCKNILRFSPYKLTNEELATMHSTNERITLENYKRFITFIKVIIENN